MNAKRNTPLSLSRRERQIMDVVYARGRASAAEVLEALPDPPSYSSVRALMRVLVEKGHLHYTEENGRYIYRALRPRRQAAREALQKVLHTFYEGSASKTVAALLDLSGKDMSDAELERLANMIEQARKEGR